MIQRKRYNLRLVLVLLGFFVLFALIIARLYILQIQQQSFFAELAGQQYRTQTTLQPPRGIITDRTGKTLLAFNREATSAFIIPHQLSEPQRLYQFLEQRYPTVYEQLHTAPDKTFVWLKRNLSPEELATLKAFDSKDIYFLTEPQRFYPFPSLAHVIGFTSIDNHGIAGLELLHDGTLHGTPSKIAFEKDGRTGRMYFKKEVIQEGKPGAPTQLTIDGTLQFIAAEELQKTVDHFEAVDGAVIIMNPENGEILAMANYPFFDPHKPPADTIEITKNRIATSCYELGSVMKAFTALAALDEQVVTLDEEIDSEGKEAYLGKFHVENWRSVGVEPFINVIRYSSNVGIAKVAKRLGPKLYDHLRRLGFGSKTNVDFPGEREGFVNHPKNWSKSSIYVLSFGYEVTASLLQLAKGFSIIANGGYDIQPHIALGKQASRGAQLYGPTPIEQTKTILETIGQNHAPAGVRVLGKTGTARILEGGAYNPNRHIYTFAGIVEDGGYRRVIVTFVNDPKRSNLYASEVTAPLFKRIATRMVARDRTVRG